jgi:hypothetical protein
MNKALQLTVCGLALALGLPGRAMAQERFFDKGERFVKVLGVEQLNEEGVTRIKVRLYYWEPWFEKKLIGQGQIGRLMVSRYLVKWGKELKWTDGTVQLRSKADIRCFPAPQWDARREQWTPAPLTGKDKNDKKPGLPGDVEDIRQGGWLTIALQENTKGELFARRVMVHHGYEKVMGKTP